jgi:hypothetical protein
MSILPEAAGGGIWDGENNKIGSGLKYFREKDETESREIK